MPMKMPEATRHKDQDLCMFFIELFSLFGYAA
uniref:Uncharacterized protein n=1 Tax=Rhizophora mucronata TaxID=61149 RepID=A0A2P2P5L0_RHIMU